MDAAMLLSSLTIPTGDDHRALPDSAPRDSLSLELQVGDRGWGGRDAKTACAEARAL